MRSLNQVFHRKKILVTGGTGSIGSQLVRTLLRYKPALVRVFSRDEAKQFQLREELGQPRNIDFVVGDIRSKESLSEACKNIHFIFHSAALKQVSSCEDNPAEAVLTNALGAHNVVRCAIESKVSKVVAVSTDKAVYPASIMGATKLIMERIILAAQKQKTDTKFCVVRFGNVIDSRGSLVPLLLSRIKEKRPLTLTDEAMTRFVMTIPDACSLVLRACALCQSGEVFVLKMGRVKIKDLIQVVIEEFSPKFGISPQEVVLSVAGVCEGERLAEILFSPEESMRVKDIGKMLVISSDFKTNKVTVNFSPSSCEGDFLNRIEIVKLLKRAGCYDI
ncbi:MAG: SDR family NAD(P)-dependent oxidoreductase [Planctomycetota bacterium]